jgi:hypothetical protein
VNLFYEWKEERNDSVQITEGLNSACVVGEHDHRQYEVRFSLLKSVTNPMENNIRTLFMQLLFVFSTFPGS